ncbi:hypothetical protein [Agromyces atrinae]|uniref:Putative hemin transport protein n=1 Tax=Agromyces atrinae TaxID=592376 RepID=A0A4Q2M941_9MICO|nr:hypothetical protein [Agromyces atrinae]NYD67255.1 putative hemin transport protein [Agromyces atrinae]RXZ86913.1 hypothetical protein ESP50_07570 [Agromyces atrinae]
MSDRDEPGECRCGHSACRRAQAGTGRRSDLEAFLGDVTGRRISGRADDVAACLSLLECAVAVTSNGAAIISEAGPYVIPSFTGGALPYRESHINVRMHAPGLSVAIAADADPDAGRPAALHLFDAAGASTHRAYATSTGDALVIDGIARDGGLLPSSPRIDAEPVSATRWETGDQLAHLDSIVVDSVDRRRRLALVDPSVARRIDPGVVPLVLSHLCTVGLVVTFGVPTTTLVQLHRSRLTAVEHHAGTVSMSAGSCTVTYDRASAVECWAVRSHGVHGPTTSLELYDASWRCILVVTQLGIIGEAAHSAWEHLTDSLPDG